MYAACSCAKNTMSGTLVSKLQELGLKPTETQTDVQVRYEGLNRPLIEKVVALFEQERDHAVNVVFREPKTVGVYVNQVPNNRA